jgi:ubiquinone/menaquinone biosynthesis C-methylase UbiE
MNANTREYTGTFAIIRVYSRIIEKTVKMINISAWKSILHEIAVNGWGVLIETHNDFSLWRLIEYPRMTEYLELRRGDRVLDIGSGTSSYPLMLTREGVDVVVVELDLDRVRWQQAQVAAGKTGAGRLLAVVGDASALPIRDGAFERVTSISAIEHMFDDVAVGREISRVLAPGGLGAISVPYTTTERRSFFAGLKPFERIKRNEFVQSGKGTLVRFYTAADVEQRFGAGVGCRITKRSFFGRTWLNNWYHESRLNKYWRSFILKDWLLATLVHPIEERLLREREPFDIMFQIRREAAPAAANRSQAAEATA